MSYEELLALGEEIGNVKSHAATKEEIGSLPVNVVEETLESKSCSICLTEFVKGETVRTLPCFHHYHIDCVDKWLSVKKTCPICQKAIVEES